MKSMVAILGVAVSLAVGAVEIPPLANPGFEASSNKHPSWTYSHHAGVNAYRVAVDVDNAAEGQHSLRMERTAPQVYGLVEQRLRLPLPLSEPMRLRYAAQLRTDGVGPEGWVLVVNFLSDRRAILDQARATPVSGTTPWRRVEIDHVAPVGTRFLAIGVMLLDDGVAWIDDVQVKWDTPPVAKP